MATVEANPVINKVNVIVINPSDVSVGILMNLYLDLSARVASIEKNLGITPPPATDYILQPEDQGDSQWWIIIHR